MPEEITNNWDTLKEEMDNFKKDYEGQIIKAQEQYQNQVQEIESLKTQISIQEAELRTKQETIERTIIDIHKKTTDIDSQISGAKTQFDQQKNEAKTQFDKQKDDLNKMQDNAMQFIALFATIIALIVVDINFLKSFDDNLLTLLGVLFALNITPLLFFLCVIYIFNKKNNHK